MNGYVQLFGPQRGTTVEGWLPPPCEWTLVPDGLYGTTNFQRDILEAQEPWIVVPVLGVIGVNNAGRQARKVKATCFLETRFLLDRGAAQLKFIEIDAPYFNFYCNVYPISMRPKILRAQDLHWQVVAGRRRSCMFGKSAGVKTILDFCLKLVG